FLHVALPSDFCFRSLRDALPISLRFSAIWLRQDCYPKFFNRRAGDVLRPPVDSFHWQPVRISHKLRFAGTPEPRGGAMCRGKHVLGACVALAALAGASDFEAQGESRKPALTIEQLIEIKHPSDPLWSPDNKHVAFVWDRADIRSEEHTSELQSRGHLVCRLLLEKKKKQ